MRRAPYLYSTGSKIVVQNTKTEMVGPEVVSVTLKEREGLKCILVAQGSQQVGLVFMTL